MSPDLEWGGDGALRQQIAEWTKLRGKSPRLYPGSLVWCLKKSGRDLREKVELWLAWKRAAGNVVAVQPPGFAAAYFRYDARNQNTQALSGAGMAMYFAYDGAGNRVTAMRVQAGHTAYFGYDALDRLKAVQDALGNNSYFGYDAGGNLTASADPLLHTTYFAYDPLGSHHRGGQPAVEYGVLWL
jgi:YD repeat-containing protein